VGSLLHLHDAHERAQILLPWRVNGTLEEAEAALVDAHLAECAECRADLAAEGALRAELAALPLGLELRQPPHVTGTAVPPRPRAPARRRFLARRIPLGWALAGQAAAAAAVALFLMVPQADRQAAPTYRLLGTEKPRATGNVIVLFAPDATERELRTALEDAGGRLVDGPTASGAYIVQVAPEKRPEALQRLRATSHVMLAEPVDAGAAP
jgi:hypothetical protein